MDMEVTSRRKTRLEEQVFFDDPALDRALGMLLALAMDHFVLKERVRALEAQLGANGFVDPAALSAAPTGPEAEAVSAQAEEFVAALMAPVLGRQQSASLPGKLRLSARQESAR